MSHNLVGLFNYIAALFMILFGIYIMIARTNLIRKIIGMTVLQTGVILFYISVAVKRNAVIPIIGSHGHINPDLYQNPLPQALMLTAIVVGVSTLGVALVLVISIYRSFQTIEEDEILKAMPATDKKTIKQGNTP